MRDERADAKYWAGWSWRTYGWLFSVQYGSRSNRKLPFIVITHINRWRWTWSEVIYNETREREMLRREQQQQEQGAHSWRLSVLNIVNVLLFLFSLADDFESGQGERERGREKETFVRKKDSVHEISFVETDFSERHESLGKRWFCLHVWKVMERIWLAKRTWRIDLKDALAAQDECLDVSSIISLSVCFLHLRNHYKVVAHK